MGSNSIKIMSKRCQLGLSNTQLLFTETSLTNQPWNWRSFTRSFHHQLTKVKDPKISHSFHKSRSISSSSTSSKVGFLRWYLSKLESYPLITKSISSSLIYAAADFTSQMITSPGSFDSIRTLRMAAYGLLILGPSQHWWFNSVSVVLPKRDVLTTLKKILMGQAIYGPCITTIFFSYNATLQGFLFGWMLLLEPQRYFYFPIYRNIDHYLAIAWLLLAAGESGSEVVARLKRDLLPTLINGLLYWPICDFVTYKFMPVHLQPLVNSSCAYLWTIYLTYMASLKKVSTD